MSQIREMAFSPETIFIDKSVADHPLTLKTLLQFPNTPVEYNINIDEPIQMNPENFELMFLVQENEI